MCCELFIVYKRKILNKWIFFMTLVFFFKMKFLLKNSTFHSICFCIFNWNTLLTANTRNKALWTLFFFKFSIYSYSNAISSKSPKTVKILLVTRNMNQNGLVLIKLTFWKRRIKLNLFSFSWRCQFIFQFCNESK